MNLVREQENTQKTEGSKKKCKKKKAGRMVKNEGAGSQDPLFESLIDYRITPLE